MMSGLKTLSLEMAARAPEPDRDIVPKNLSADHRHHFALSGVDFAGH